MNLHPVLRCLNAASRQHRHVVPCGKNGQKMAVFAFFTHNHPRSGNRSALCPAGQYPLRGGFWGRKTKPAISDHSARMERSCGNRKAEMGAELSAAAGSPLPLPSVKQQQQRRFGCTVAEQITKALAMTKEGRGLSVASTKQILTAQRLQPRAPHLTGQPPPCTAWRAEARWWRQPAAAPWSRALVAAAACLHIARTAGFPLRTAGFDEDCSTEGAVERWSSFWSRSSFPAILHLQVGWPGNTSGIQHV
ncbi:uncharacterized protein [Narcine bancroftii]|uniref:uncharacterized protein n=1 Tax=Narcine bancroftii TaxID=1343680 RepID=UPI003831638C